MKKLSETLKEMGIAFSFPLRIKDERGKLTYFENSNGYWCTWEHEENGSVTRLIGRDGYWSKSEYDENNTCTYFQDSTGLKRGNPRSAKTCEGKVVVVDGVEYELKAL